MTYIDVNITNANGLSVAEKNQEYFVLFKEVTSTTPEIIEKSNFFVTYVVDAEGNIFKPSDDNSAKYNLLQNFDEGKPVTVILDKATSNNSQLAGSHTLLAVGSPIPYLYSQNGIPSSSYETTLYFRDINSSPSGAYATIYDGRGAMVNTGSGTGTVGLTAHLATVDGLPETFVSYSKILNAPEAEAAGFNITTGQYTALNTSQWIDNLDTINFKFSCTMYNGSTTSRGPFKLKIQHPPIDYGPVTIVETASMFPGPATVTPFGILSSSVFISIEGTTTKQNFDLFSQKVQVVIDFNPGDVDYIGIKDATFQSTLQNPTPTSNFYSTESHGDYWIESPNTESLWITGSDRFSILYGKDTVYIPSTTQTTFGFDPVTEPFFITPGDRIRFEYNPQQEYIIYEVQDPNVDGNLKLKLNNIPPSQSNMQNFVLYKLDKNTPRNLILDIEKDTSGIDDPTNPFTGIILPQYPSSQVLSNLDNVLQKLKQDGTIEN